MICLSSKSHFLHRISLTAHLKNTLGYLTVLARKNNLRQCGCGGAPTGNNNTGFVQLFSHSARCQPPPPPLVTVNGAVTSSDCTFVSQRLRLSSSVSSRHPSQLVAYQSCQRHSFCTDSSQATSTNKQKRRMVSLVVFAFY